MTCEIVSKRQISKRMKLVKTVREVYKHSNLNFFDSNFEFNKPILLLSREIVESYSTVLLCKDYHFIICSSLSIDLEKEKTLKKLNANLIFINGEFIEELASLCDEPVAENLKKICNYLSSRYPQGRFDILNIQSINQYFQNTLFNDLNININMPVPFDQLIDDSNITQNQYLDNTGTFEEYFENLESHHKSGEISKGTLMVSPLNCFEGEVVEKDKRIKIKGKSLNRAMHGDEVFVKDDRIVGIFKSKTRTVVGTLIKIVESTDFNFGLIRPIDRKLSDIYVATYLSEEYLNRKVVVHIVDWCVLEALPRGIIFKILGFNGNFQDELIAIKEHCNIEYRDESWNEALNRQRRNLDLPIYSGSNSKQDELNCETLGFDKYEFSVQRAEKEILTNARRDLRHLDVCSVDPKGCTDIDDALHCIQHEDHIEIGVHIADVSFYVTENSILDIEAKSRSTTVYLPGERIDMLPAFLSSELCSLLQDKDRATFSCIWKFDLDFNLISHEIVRTMIKSKAALSYEEAHEIIISNTPHPLKASLELLSTISRKLRTKRFNNGALELSSQEIYVDDQNNVKVKESVPTHHMVEEFMLLANITVAKFIHKYNPEYSLLRKHPLPSAILLDNIDCTSSKTINDSLNLLNEDQRIISKKIITRSMQQALYFCSGESSDFYHYGLATPLYTHFTSPIRRYPDVLVHRTLAYILNGDEESLDRLKFYVNNESCSKMNYRHRNAQTAGRMASSLYICKAIENLSEDATMEASIVSIKSDGIVVFIKNYGVEAFVKTEQKYKVFDTLKVKIIQNFKDYCQSRFFNVTIVDKSIDVSV